jgi:uncharacterized protein YbjT (DUF2867 family)
MIPPTSAAQPIAVFGATGAQGGPVVEALLRAGRPVRAVARNAERLTALARRGAQPAAADLGDARAVRTALDGVAGAFVHLPFMPVPELIERWSTVVAQAVLDSSVPTVFTLSGPPSSTPIGVPSFDTKALAKRILVEAGVPLVGLEPTGYLGNLSAFFSAPSVVNADELRYPLPATHRQPWISVEDQAAIAVAALERPDLRGRWFRIGQQLTGPEIAEAVGQARGRPVRYVPLDPEEFGRSLAPVMGEPIGAALAADYRALGERRSELALDTDTHEIQRELGLAATPVVDWARNQDWEAAAAVVSAP